MKATEINEKGVHTPYPIITFNIEIENNEIENRIIFTNIVSTVETLSPMRRLSLGRLSPCKAFMALDKGESDSFNFELDLGWKSLYDLENVRQNQPDFGQEKDVWLDIYIEIVYMEVEDWNPIKYGHKRFHVGKGIHGEKIRIPHSDWSKLRTELGYGKMRIIEVTKETYKLIEEYMDLITERNTNEAINASILDSLSRKRKK